MILEVKSNSRRARKLMRSSTCAWSDGKAYLKKTQGTGNRKKVEKSSCIAIEAQDYVDGINRPEWGRVDAQITGPGEVYSWETSWTFGLM